MCYFVSVGATLPAHRLASLFHEQSEFDVAAVPVCASVARAFPPEDEVSVVTSRGCSCDLVAPQKRTVKHATAFQRAIARIVRDSGSVRLVVHRHRGECQLTSPAARVSLSVNELVAREYWFVEDVVMEISRDGGPSAPGLSS